MSTEGGRYCPKLILFVTSRVFPLCRGLRSHIWRQKSSVAQHLSVDTPRRRGRWRHYQLPIAAPLYPYAPPSAGPPDSVAAVAATAVVSNIREQSMHQQNLLLRQQNLLQRQQAEIMRLHEALEEARDSSVSTPPVATPTRWPFSPPLPASPQKRWAEADSPFLHFLAGITPKRLHF